MTTPKTPQAVLLCIGLFIGCESKTQTIEATSLDNGLRERQRAEEPKLQKVFADEELETMASHEPREGTGMSFYYDELRKRNDAKWAKEELERRKAINK